MGELGFIDPNNRRTATVESLEDSAVLTITYDRLLELYFQNPEFGYYFLRLTTERLMQNITRLEGSLADTKAQIAAVAAPAARPDRRLEIDPHALARHDGARPRRFGGGLDVVHEGVVVVGIVMEQAQPCRRRLPQRAARPAASSNGPSRRGTSAPRRCRSRR